jgi:drug/metabolite transporter (DMT)-like permease
LIWSSGGAARRRAAGWQHSEFAPPWPGHLPSGWNLSAGGASLIGMADRDRRPGRFTTYLLLAGGMAVFGSATPISKIVTDAFPVFLAAALRMATAVVVLAPLVRAQGLDLRALSRRDWIVVGLIALFGMVGFTVAMLYGMKLVSGVAGSIVMSTTPAVTALGAFLFLGERLGWRRIAGVACAVAGVLILHVAGKSGAAAGDLVLGSLLVFAAVCCEAAYTLLGKRATDRLSAAAIAALSGALAGVLFVPLAIWQAWSFDFAGPALGQWAALLWWGAGTMALGSVLWYRGLARAAGGTAAAFMGVMPVSALVLSYALLGEPFRWVHLVGFAVVFAGVVLVATAHAREAAPG